jgi:polysaccharide biosynthesis/export protein
LKNILLILLAFLSIPVSTSVHAEPPKSQLNLSAYKLAPGDVLEVTVWKEEDLHKQIIIAPDGTISLPLVETITAAGKTTTELKQIISEKLASYMTDPAVTVSLIKNDGNTIFVIGKVNRPGQYSASRYIDALQAISLAGGLTVFAKESSIHILRRTGGTIQVFNFDYDDVLDGENLHQNIILEPGDTVTVQ